MNAADRRRLTPALGILVVALVALLIALWAGVGRGAHWNDDASPPPLPPVRAATPPPSVPPLEKFAVVWERPLFSPDRKPIPAAAGSSKNANTGDFELTGVIMLPGLHMALLREKNSGHTLRVREGRSADGATVVEVKPRSAVVEINGSRTELPLKVEATPPNSGAREAGAPSSQSMTPTAQPVENAAPEPAPPSSSEPEQSSPRGNGSPAAGTPEQSTQAGTSPAPATSARAPKQSAELTNKEAADAWARALKARIEKRRKQAAQKQDANKQNGG